MRHAPHDMRLLYPVGDQRRSFVKHFWYGLSISFAFIIGCLAAPAIVQPLTAQTTAVVRTNPAAAQRWEYMCTDGYNAPTITERANQAGAVGWEMVAAVGSPRAPGLWCFKRPL